MKALVYEGKEKEKKKRKEKEGKKNLSNIIDLNAVVYEEKEKDKKKRKKREGGKEPEQHYRLERRMCFSYSSTHTLN